MSQTFFTLWSNRKMEAAGLISADQETPVPKRAGSHRDRRPFAVYSFLQPLALIQLRET